LTPFSAASPNANTIMPGRASAIIAADTGTTSIAIASSAQRSERANAS
jgi:hypothetical protein